MKKILAIVLVVMLTSTLLLLGSGGYKQLAAQEIEYGYNVLPMQRYNGCGYSGEHPCNACGPCSAVSIGRYYRDVRGYSRLPGDNTMYDDLYDCFPTYGGATSPYNYGDGFDEMTNLPNYHYHNFNPVSDGELFGGEVTPDDYDKIVDAIDNGWPVALCGNFWGVGYVYKSGNGDWPYLYGHYVAIKGYSYSKNLPSGEYDYRHIYCTDSYSGSDTLILDWDVVMIEGSDFTTITIKDNLIEDFEWGNDGASLSTSGGDVTWQVTKNGYSKAEIDTMTEHLGDRSARIYRDGSNTVYAYYSKYRPDIIGFHLRKDGTACATVTNGDGTRRLEIRITSTEAIQYCDDTGYQNTGHTISTSTWYLMELRNINWVAGTYDIYLNDNPIKSGATMRTSSSYAGRIYYGSWEGKGSFWIDEIYR